MMLVQERVIVLVRIDRGCGERPVERHFVRALVIRTVVVVETVVLPFPAGKLLYA
jgi:hypothetical protein